MYSQSVLSQDVSRMSRNDPLFDAKIWLILRHPFFAHAVLDQHFEADEETVATLSTDGNAIYFNPGFVARLDIEQIAAAVCHELMHNMLFHLSRRRGRIAALWNLASDLAINNELLGAGFRLPPGSLSDQAFSGMSAEEIYSMLHEEYTNAAHNAMNSGHPSERGALKSILLRYATTEEELNESHNKWTMAGFGENEALWSSRLFKGLAQAAGRTGGGGAPGGCIRFAESLVSSPISWREELAAVIGQYVEPHDFTTTKPNLKYLSQGIHLPSLEFNNTLEVFIALDSSASIDRRLLGEFLNGLRVILDHVDSARVITFDTEVYEVGRFDAGLSDPETAFGNGMKGGGGTDFRAVFHYLERGPRPPDLAIIFTDLDGRFPESLPGYPVIWAVTRECTLVPPFGHLVMLRMIP